jgi:NADH-quinone oxidoreductase subunit C
MDNQYKYIDKAALKDLGEYIKDYVKNVDLQVEINDCNELVLHIISADIIKFLTFLRDDTYCKFEQLVDICAVDYPSAEKRFEINYHLSSVVLNQRIRVKFSVLEKTTVKSVVSVFPCAGWYEREIWDMFGIAFSGNPDLRRILTDYGFEGHPLRKDFPLVGFVQVRYDEELKRIVHEPTNLEQNLRRRENLSPWEGYCDGCAYKNADAEEASEVALEPEEELKEEQVEGKAGE